MAVKKRVAELYNHCCLVCGEPAEVKGYCREHAEDERFEECQDSRPGSGIPAND